MPQSLNVVLFFLQTFREARRVAPSVIYLPHLDSLWSTTTDTLKATFVSLVNDLPPGLPVLLFATCDLPVSKIPPDLSLLFSVSCGQVRCLVAHIPWVFVFFVCFLISTIVTASVYIWK